MSRVVGIIHRTKRTAEGEARPTRVAIISSEDTVTYDLSDETSELDFLKGQFPTAYRPVAEGEDVTAFKPHQLIWRKLKDDEKTKEFPAGWTRSVINEKGKPEMQLVTKVPTAWDGLKERDDVAMYLGGSGGYFAAALSRQGERISARVFRAPPSFVKTWRGNVVDEEAKNRDHLLLASELQKRLVSCQLDPFYQLRARDRGLIRVNECLRLRQEALVARIGCEQRIRQNAIGRIFLSEEGAYPEGTVSAIYRHAEDNNTVLQALQTELASRDKDLKQAVQSLRLWTEFFSTIKGVGPRIAAGIIAPIGDIRRFWVDPKQYGMKQARQKGMARLKKFCGVHVMPDGSFPRRRTGQLCNWSPGARQTLYLVVDQFNRRPDSVWGKKLLEIKARLRLIHPEPVEVEVKGKKVKRYTNGHIHKMALWRCATKFVEFLFKQWTKIELQDIARERGEGNDSGNNTLPPTPPRDEDDDSDEVELSAA